MKKKIKFWILANLLASSTLLVVMPIISCSSNKEEAENNSKIEITISKPSQEAINTVAPIIRKVAISTGGINDVISENDFNKIKKDVFYNSSSTGKDFEVWNTISKIYGNFKKGSEVIPFATAVLGIKIRGEYPQELLTGEPVIAYIDIVLNQEYNTALWNMFFVSQVGISE